MPAVGAERPARDDAVDMNVLEPTVTIPGVSIPKLCGFTTASIRSPEASLKSLLRLVGQMAR